MKATAPSPSSVSGYPGCVVGPQRCRAGSLRLLVWLLAALLAWPAWGQAGVAELSVTAYGRQRLDLETGRTVLEDGGELVDRTSGVRIAAAWIAYLDGIEVVARGVTLDGDVGRVEAGEIAVDLLGGRLQATGGVRWLRPGVDVTGRSLWFDVGAGVAGLVGGIEATAPEVSAAEVWIELASGRVLLVGPYRYADGRLVLTGGADAALQLDVVEVAGVPGYDARSAVDPDWAETVARLRGEPWAAAGE